MTSSHETMIDLVPKPVNNIEMEIIEGEVLLYHPQITRAVYLNQTAAVIWSLCEGIRSVREVIHLIGESYPEADNLARLFQRQNPRKPQRQIAPIEERSQTLGAQDRSDLRRMAPVQARVADKDIVGLGRHSHLVPISSAAITILVEA